MSKPSLKKLEETAVHAAHRAGKILRNYFNSKKFRVREKLNAGLVTDADTEAEKAALKILSGSFPDFLILAEESQPSKEIAPSSRSTGRWIIDPLDGTTNFVHGFPMFCVSIAAQWENETLVGVIYHPILDETYVAVKGRGARLDGRKMQVSKTSQLKGSLLTTGFTYRKDDLLHQEMEAFERLSGIARAIRRPGSAALDLAYVARGVFDGFWERRLSPWDVAAGYLLVQEAGGKVSNFKGQKFDPEMHEILATNSKLHRPLLQCIAPEFCPI